MANFVILENSWNNLQNQPPKKLYKVKKSTDFAAILLCYIILYFGTKIKGQPHQVNKVGTALHKIIFTLIHVSYNELGSSASRNSFFVEE